MATLLFDLLRRVDRETRERLGVSAERVVLPILRWIPVEDAEQLEWRLQLLSDITGRKPDLGGKMLVTLLRKERVRPSVTREPTDLVLRFFREWKLAAAAEGERISRLIYQASLLRVYATAPVKKQDTLLHLGLRLLLHDVQGEVRLGGVREELVREYSGEVGDWLRQALRATTARTARSA